VIGNSIVVREYARLTTEEAGTAAFENTLDRAVVSVSAYDWLCQLNQGFSAAGAPLVVVEGRTWLRLDKYVGVIETPCGTRIEILPKHHEVGDVIAESRRLLRQMIQTAYDLPKRDAGLADLQLFNAPLTEWVMTNFLTALAHIVKVGIRFDYRRVEEEQRYLRGQLNVVHQMRQPPGKQHFFHIRHDVFDPDCAENRLLKRALEIVVKTTRDAANWKIASELNVLMSEIESCKNIGEDFNRWRNDRLLSHYRPVKPWCELILGQQMPLSVAGDWRGLSLLFPMDKLFERYVATWLRRRISPIGLLRSPARSEHLTVHDEEKMFGLEPDLLIESGCMKWVLDTKWKKLDSTKRSKNYDLSRSDFYQLYAYGKKYLAGQTSSELVLIYPKTSSFSKSLPVFDYGDGLKLWVLPFDLDAMILIDAELTTLPVEAHAIEKRATYKHAPKFLDAQAKADIDKVLGELRAGQKLTHWMWFVFPQLKALGRSETAICYGLDGLEEAREWLAHPVLSKRLLDCTKAVLMHPGKSITSIMGTPDDLKLRSCMTLFHLAAPAHPLFRDVLRIFYGDQLDDQTIELLSLSS
jgi:5-methylcytosine-specific restriction enzyme subunit McrC